jgi:hypothetical protein
MSVRSVLLTMPCFCFSRSRVELRRGKHGTGDCDQTSLVCSLARRSNAQRMVQAVHPSYRCSRPLTYSVVERVAPAINKQVHGDMRTEEYGGTPMRARPPIDRCLARAWASEKGGKPCLWTEAEKETSCKVLRDLVLPTSHDER